ncbi:MAG: hypothetical protein JHD35_26440 [Sphingopyxis sp.]|nr:hypothetical protein [Sphingopyxis sp.]
MKLLVRQYLASLKERNELDAILPDLLSEVGFHVYSRPQRGTRQHGVDVAAYGPDEDGEHKVFLFSVKSGDLTRQDWADGSPQSLRASLNEIRDAYISTRIPAEYSDRKIVICLCYGGELHEQVQDSVRGYIRQNQTDRISYQEWNGDRLANLILSGILREDLLPKQNRSSFQKAVAMVDTPDVSYRYFSELIGRIVKQPNSQERAQLSAARQLNICLWILFVWARDVDNLEAPYRASELVILHVWEMCRPLIGNSNSHTEAMVSALQQVIGLHLSISLEFLERKILPHVGKLDAIATAVHARSSVDINQKLFDLAGRIAMAGIWLHWLSDKVDTSVAATTQEEIARLNASVFRLISNNTALLLPLCDINSIEIAIVLVLSVMARTNLGDVRQWLTEMANRLDFTLRTHGRYTCAFTEYRLLINHPRARTEEYRKEATSVSTLIPLLVAWLGALGANEEVSTLSELKRTILSHCTLQLWLPDADSESSFYLGNHDHGIAVTDIPIDIPSDRYLAVVLNACTRKTAFEGLSAIQSGFWPIVLLACRHHRFPVPPQFWIHMLHVDAEGSLTEDKSASGQDEAP